MCVVGGEGQSLISLPTPLPDGYSLLLSSGHWQKHTSEAGATNYGGNPDIYTRKGQRSESPSLSQPADGDRFPVNRAVGQECEGALSPAVGQWFFST